MLWVLVCLRLDCNCLPVGCLIDCLVGLVMVLYYLLVWVLICSLCDCLAALRFDLICLILIDC